MCSNIYVAKNPQQQWCQIAILHLSQAKYGPVSDHMAHNYIMKTKQIIQSDDFNYFFFQHGASWAGFVPGEGKKITTAA